VLLEKFILSFKMNSQLFHIDELFLNKFMKKII